MSGKRFYFGGHEVPERQLQVWREMALSNTTKGIAADLGIGEKAVEYHRAKLYRNLGIFDVAGITREAIKTGVIKL